MYTPQEYAFRLKEIFSSSRIKCVVKDVFIVPDYCDWLENHIDKDFGRCHKTIHTQHQWVFEKTEACEDFPLGCKTMYRAYARDQVVEIVKSSFPHENACGRLIGYKAIQVDVYWYPRGNPGR